MAEKPRRAAPFWAVALCLTAAVVAVYARACDLGFVNFDDDDYVTANAHVQRGLSLGGLGWALTTLDAVNWHPLTWLSLQLDVQLFGPYAAAFHRTNLLLHAANTVLLFALLRRLTGALWRSAAVAALFGLHPAHVEAVAWVTARKDVLSTLCWLLTTAAYAWYAERPGLRRYLLVVALFALGLTAKPMLVTLPATLLLLDYWPLRRWPAGTTRYAPASPRRLLAEKLPLFVLVVPAVVLTLLAQKPIINTLADYSLYDRLANALVSCVRYLRMAVWPAGLAILYPLPRETVPVWQAAGAAALLLALTTAAVWAGRSRRYLLVGWLWFLGTLAPVIGLIQNGPQALADRYTYVPYIGLSLIPVWGLAELCRRGTPARAGLGVLAGGALVGFAVLAWLQVGCWRDSETLWRHALAVTPPNRGAEAMLAMALAEKGAFAEAADHFEASLRLDPDNAATHVNLAAALVPLGRLDDAAAHLERSLELRPGAAGAHYNLGAVRAQQGRLGEALRHYRAAVEIEPHSARLHAELGRLLKRQGRLADALACYDAALALKADDAATWNHKGVALEGLGRLEPAAACYRRAAGLRPDQLVYRLNLASVALGRRRMEEAAEQLRAASELAPDWPRVALGEAWALATHPDARRRDGKLALRTAALVCAATHDEMGQALDVRAAAHAELGQFAEAVAWQRRALALLPADAPAWLRAALEDRLRGYEKQQPYRHPAAP
jgi:tetratricopeptide (TPR) repeat protein